MRYEDERTLDEVEREKYEQRRIRRRKRRRRQQMIRLAIMLSILPVTLIVIVGAVQFVKYITREEEAMADEIKYIQEPPDYRVELLDINEYSRPGTDMESVNGIVIHYTANPGTTAEQNRSYFENLMDTGETYASSHFVVGLDGEIVQCIPCNEVAYASNERNADTISIECCIPDESGQFSEATYESVVELVTWLMGRYDLSAEQVIRHYDVTGKACPKYYVENEDAWEQFRVDLLAYIDMYGIAKTEEIK
jgi:N-acetyl-anhydromuramyl-L-alanine amidase AmpD